MKKLVFLLLISIQQVFFAQTLIQAFNEPVVGDTDKTYAIDTLALTGSMPLAITGSNSVWNFTGLTISNTVLTIPYQSTLTVPASSAYPGSSVVQNQGGLFTFIKSVKTPSTQTEVLGVFSTSLVLTFTNTAIAAKFPVSFGNTSTDNISGTFNFAGNAGTCSGNITTNADGLGTLNLPNKLSYNNVLRVKSVQTLNLTLGFIPLGTVKQTIYNFYHGSQKFPVLSVNYQSISLLGGGSPTVTAFVSGNARVLIAGFNENKMDEMEISFYPNPLKTVLHFYVNETYKPKQINIYNELSQLVYSCPYKQKVDMYDFHDGLYFVEIETEKGRITKRIVKESE